MPSADAGRGRRARGVEWPRVDQPAQSLALRRDLSHPPPAVSGRRPEAQYITQAKARPPGFVLFCSRADAIPESYQRYLINSLRDTFDLPGTPIRMALREKDNPFAGRAKKKR
jgi:predicted GTPase